MTDWNHIPENVGEPNFENLLTVLRRGIPERPTLFEFFLNDRLYNQLAPLSDAKSDSSCAAQRQALRAYHRAGYDFANMIIPGFEFPSKRTEGTRTISINEGGLIHDRTSFESYPSPNPDMGDYAILDALAADLPLGMKLIGYGPNGVLENAIRIVGFETLCYLLADDPILVEKIFAEIGE